MAETELNAVKVFDVQSGEPDSSYSNLASFLMNEAVIVSLYNKLSALSP